MSLLSKADDHAGETKQQQQQEEEEEERFRVQGSGLREQLAP